MTIPRLVIASKNPDKISEVEAVLADLDLASEIVRGLDWPDVDETGDTLEANALLKADTVARVTGLPALADDTGLEVAALGGLPGVNTARFAGSEATYDDNVTRLLADLEPATDRSARFVTVVTLAYPDGRHVTAMGDLAGRISPRRRGSGGFGYDPVFEVDGETMSEMGVLRKNELSHRARALRALAANLRG